jgi:hypothetical protein
MILPSIEFTVRWLIRFCFQEWADKQSSLKEEEIDVTFSYWDGSGHRRTVRMKKGNWKPLFDGTCSNLC